MIIECPNCSFSGSTPDDKIPEGGITATCPKCKENFQVLREKEPDSALQDVPTCFCPKCGTSQPISDTCVKCGVVFYKFLNRQLQQHAEGGNPTAVGPTSAGTLIDALSRHRTFNLKPLLDKIPRQKQDKQRPQKNYSTLWKCVLVFFVVGVIGNIAALSGSNTRISSSPPATPPVTDQHSKRLSVEELDQVCAKEIASRLKAPSTAKFTKEGHAFTNDGGKDLYLTRIIVDAQNSYGAMIRDRFSCKEEASSGQIVDLYSDSEMKEMDDKRQKLQEELNRRNPQ